ncbi:MAG: SGNH/GDSL hydrolase family protein [Planctomycetes bacterium]|nr:SGNH/GDSL hydrolase family protein [Planctomycetota bacterium]
MASFPKKLLLLSGALVVACVLAELGLRLFAPIAVGISHQPCIYRRDAGTGFAYVPGSRDRMQRFFEMDTVVQINADGCHDVERAAGAASAFRVAAIGDSFTACLHVPIADGWTQQLEHELGRRRGAPGEVHNLGLDGTGTDVQVRLLAAALARGQRFDTVILAFYGNDVEDVALGPLYREVVDGYVVTYQDEAQRSTMLQWLAAHRPSAWLAAAYRSSLLVRALCNTFGGSTLLRSNFVWPGQVGLEVRHRAPQAPLEQACRDLATLAQRHGFRVLVVPVPARHDAMGSMKVLTQNLPAYALQPFAVVDVVPDMERLLAGAQLTYQQLFWQHDDHLNAAGNRLFAQALAERMPPR